ncbi:hypothetical protein HQQ94_11360 [Shewanella sp. VB17]|uniref:hypothetical protein n=1 Tax=Shewanella sp. VB17 TaxID=2739432 RepID=UPI001565C306|nr:hypothetical protein [Shewanella sp. VB17]NRD73824.1 hypothetical protein [Shewanella sp. VB17]
MLCFMQDKHKQYTGRDDYINGTMPKAQRDKVDSLGDTLGKIEEVDAVKYIGIEQKFDQQGNLSTAAVKFFD